MSWQKTWDGRSYYGGKHRKQRAGKEKHFSALTFLLTLVFVGIFCFCALEGISLGGAHDEIKGDPQVMVILGCQVKPWGPSVLLQDRLDKALDYLRDHPDMTVVVSGGQGKDEHISEAQCMYEYLTAHGVEGEHILLEDRSHNTWQNLNYSLDLLGEKGYDTTADIMVASNGWHLARVRMLYDRIYSSDYLSTLAAPTSHAPSRLKMYIREPIGLVKSFLLDR